MGQNQTGGRKLAVLARVGQTICTCPHHHQNNICLSPSAFSPKSSAGGPAELQRPLEWTGDWTGDRHWPRKVPVPMRAPWRLMGRRLSPSVRATVRACPPSRPHQPPIEDGDRTLGTGTCALLRRRSAGATAAADVVPVPNAVPTVREVPVPSGPYRPRGSRVPVPNRGAPAAERRSYSGGRCCACPQRANAPAPERPEGCLSPTAHQPPRSGGGAPELQRQENRLVSFACGPRHGRARQRPRLKWGQAPDN